MPPDFVDAAMRNKELVTSDAKAAGAQVATPAGGI
jgi:hypothetical protein